MLFSEFEQTLSDPDSITIDPLLRVERSIDDFCVVDGLYAFPLAATSHLFPRAQSISVVDPEGHLLGELITCGGEPFAIPQFSAGYLASYLRETNYSAFGQAGTFSRDYLVIREERIEDYKSNYMDGSLVWGGFQHDAMLTPSLTVTSTATIYAAKGVSLITDVHLETARRSVVQPFAFERFLKLYHLLELSFDHSIVLKIQALGPDLKGIGQLISGLESNELHRLKQIISTCRSPERVITCIQAITSDDRWHVHLKTIFFDFGKSGNPVPQNKEQEFTTAICSGDGYTLEEMQSVAGLPRLATLQLAAFNTFSLNLAAYWIYRIRSSIAHNRLGEYVMRDDDESFVAFFAEPLLRCVLSEIL